MARGGRCQDGRPPGSSLSHGVPSAPSDSESRSEASGCESRVTATSCDGLRRSHGAPPAARTRSPLAGPGSRLGPGLRVGRRPVGAAAAACKLHCSLHARLGELASEVFEKLAARCHPLNCTNLIAPIFISPCAHLGLVPLCALSQRRAQSEMTPLGSFSPSHGSDCQ